MSLDDTLTLGPVRLPFWLVAVGLALVVMKIVLTLTVRANAKKWENSVWNALLAGFAVWKLSPLLGSWDRIGKEPLALLYLPGTAVGLGLGVAIAALWLGWNVWKAETRSLRLVLALGGSLAASAATMGLVAGVLSLIPSGKPVVTQKALVLSTLDGGEATLARAPGKVLFVNFWATWCPPCRAEVPEFVDFWAKADPAVAIQAVDLMTSEQDPSQVAPFATAEGMTFPILIDAEGKAAGQYQITSIPTTLVFDPKGALVLRHTGAMTRDMMESLVRQYR
jgi:thiol-disulfide isomerase/thioredoxin